MIKVFYDDCTTVIFAPAPRTLRPRTTHPRAFGCGVSLEEVRQIARAHTHTRTHRRTHTHTYAHAHAHAHAHARTHAHAYAHAYAHAHTRTHARAFL